MELDVLVEQGVRPPAGGGLVEQDEAKRDEYYIEMQKLWDEAVHTVWLSWPTKHFAFKNGLEPAILPHGRVLPQGFRPAA